VPVPLPVGRGIAFNISPYVAVRFVGQLTVGTVCCGGGSGGGGSGGDGGSGCGGGGS
jgi:hypothetical protein